MSYRNVRHVEMTTDDILHRFCLMIGIGNWAEKRASEALAGLPGVKFGRVLHPSPASPAANRGWAEAATRQLTELGVWRS